MRGIPKAAPAAGLHRPERAVRTPEPKNLNLTRTPASSELLCASETEQEEDEEEEEPEDGDASGAKKRPAAVSKRPAGRPCKRPAAAEAAAADEAEAEPAEALVAAADEAAEATEAEAAEAAEAAESSGAATADDGGDGGEEAAKQEGREFTHEPSKANPKKRYQTSEYFFIAGRSGLTSTEARAAWTHMSPANRKIWLGHCAKHNAAVQ